MQLLTALCAVTSRLVLYASNHPDLPARRKTEAETIALLQLLGYDEVMRIERTWPFPND